MPRPGPVSVPVRSGDTWLGVLRLAGSGHVSLTDYSDWPAQTTCPHRPRHQGARLGILGLADSGHMLRHMLGHRHTPGQGVAPSKVAPVLGTEGGLRALCGPQGTAAARPRNPRRSREEAGSAPRGACRGPYIPRTRKREAFSAAAPRRTRPWDDGESLPRPGLARSTSVDERGLRHPPGATEVRPSPNVGSGVRSRS